MTLSRRSTHLLVQRQVAAFVLTLAVSSFSSFAHAAKPTSKAAQVDAVFASYKRARTPGCAVAVMRNDKIIYKRGYGLASLEHNVAIDPDSTRFNIASASKQFTAAAILLLVQDGKISLDDDVRKHIPELRDYGHPVRIHHLLHHTSGIRDYYTLLELAFVSPTDYTTNAQTMGIITRQSKLEFVPGQAWSYSSAGYFLLGQIVERVSGKTLRDFCQERIFKPLGMEHTEFLARYDQVVADVATGYRAEPDGSYSVNMSNWMTAGPSGLRTTVSDLAKWDKNFYSGRVGGSWLSQELPRMGQLNSGETINYARGLIVIEQRGTTQVSHDGRFAGYSSELLRLPQHHFSVAVLCNNDDASPNDFASQIVDIYLGPTLGKNDDHSPALTPGPLSPTAHDRENWRPWIGTYWDHKNASVRRIEERDGRLYYIRGDDPGFELELIGERRFRIKGRSRLTEVVFSGGGREPHRMRVRVDGAPAALGGQSDLVRVAEFVPKSALAEYAGRFYSRDLRLTWTIVVRNKRLVLLDPHGVELELRPAFKDTWDLDGGAYLHYQRNAAQKIVGLVVDTNRAHGIEFVRVKRHAK